ARRRAASRTADGAPDQVSTTASHFPPSSASSPPSAVRSPCSARTPPGGSCRPLWKTVTSHPRVRAPSVTARPTNSVPPSIRSFMRKPCPLYVLYGTLARSKRNTPNGPPPRGPALDEALRRDLRWRGTGIIVEWEHVIS